MPNWCDNKLTVTHADFANIDKFVGAYMNNRLCSYYLPPTGEDSAGWRVANWGEKWDIGPGDNEEYGLHPTVVDNEVSISFSSAWSPPLGLYERLVVLGFDVQASYFEPGMGFAGIWHNGIDEFYEGNWREFPQKLIDLFGMEEYNKEIEQEA